MSRIEAITAERVYVVADIGQNHNGSMDIARDLIDACAFAKVDCAKGQKRHLHSLFTEAELDRPYAGPHSYGATYGEHREALELSWAQHTYVAEYAEVKGIDYTVSVWDPTTLAEAEGIGGWDWIKVPSASAHWPELVSTALAGDTPVVLSTGMTDAIEMQRIIDACDTCQTWVAGLQCTSAYPCQNDAIDLRVMTTWQQAHAFDCVGYSGHHRGIAIDIAAVAMGARIIERHVTLDNTAKGTDHAAALEPGMLHKLVSNIRSVEAAMGSAVKRKHECELACEAKLRTSKMRERHDNGARATSRA